MENLLLYLLKVTGILILFFITYRLFLKGKNRFTVNRLFLLSALLLSVTIPLVNLGVAAVDGNIIAGFIHETIVITSDNINVENSAIPWFNYALVVYLTGVAIFFVKFFTGVIQLLVMRFRFGVVEGEGVKLVVVGDKYAPFSFLNLVFIPKRILTSERVDQILIHEKIHVKQMHSMDLILSELFCIVFWFNPAVWLIRKNFLELHEYLADQGALNNGLDPVDYQSLLLSEAFGTQVIGLASSFNSSLIKKRIIMMTNRNKSKGYASILMGIALAFVCSFIISNTVSGNEPDSTSQIASAKKALSFNEVEVKPEFPGGDAALLDFLMQNTKYPVEAKNKGIEGKVFVSFIIKKNGKVSDVSIIKGADALLDAEAMRVVKAMPDWKAGESDGKKVDVQYQLPLNFKLDDKKAK